MKLKQALTETSDLAQLARTQEARLDKMDNEVGRLKYEGQQMRSTVAELRTHVSKLVKEVSTRRHYTFLYDNWKRKGLFNTASLPDKVIY